MDLIQALVYLLEFMMLAIFARVILSWVVSSQGGGGVDNPIVRIVYQITDPVLLPFRKLLPRVGMFDFTPMFAMLTLIVIIAVLRDAG